MTALLVQNLRHIWRTKLLVFLLVFSFLIQYVGVRVVHSATIHFNGLITPIDLKDALFFALLFQIFTGGFLAAVYGIWMVPYAHQGMRSHLTFTLPVSKWMFPLSYAITMFVLLLLQHLVLAGSFAMNFGWGVFWSEKFPWDGVMLCLVLETVAFEVCMFAFAFSSMSLGQIPTFLLGATVLFLLQIAGVLVKVELEYSGKATAQWIYDKLPPVGDLVYDLRMGYTKPDWSEANLILWAIWLVVFVLLFRLKLRYPTKIKGET